MSVGQLTVNVVANTAKARKGLKSFRGDVKQTSKTVGVAAKSFKALSAGVASFATLAAAKGAFLSFRRMASDLTESLRAAKRLGIGVETLQQLEYAANQSGLETDQLRDSMVELELRTSEAARGTGEAVEALRDLGISAKSFQSLPTDKKLSRIADALKEVGNPGDRIRIGDQLFGGEGGTKFLSILDGGSAGLRRFAEEADKLGLTTTRNLEDVQKFTESADKLDKALTGASRELTITVSPFAVEYVNNLTRAVRLMRDQQEARSNGEGFFQSFKTAGDKMFGRALAEGLGSAASKGLGGDSGGVGDGPRMPTRTPAATSTTERKRSPGFGKALRAIEQAKAFRSFMRGTGKELGRTSNDLAGGRLFSEQASTSPNMVAAPRGINSLIDANSGEGFRALRANLRGGDNDSAKHAKETATESKKSNVHLSTIAKWQGELVSMLRNTPPPLEIPGS